MLRGKCVCAGVCIKTMMCDLKRFLKKATSLNSPMPFDLKYNHKTPIIDPTVCGMVFTAYTDIIMCSWCMGVCVYTVLTRKKLLA